MIEFLGILGLLLLGLAWLGGSGYLLGQAVHYSMEPHLSDRKAWVFLVAGILWLSVPLALVISIGN